jgi:hypothetical protein
MDKAKRRYSKEAWAHRKAYQKKWNSLYGARRWNELRLKKEANQAWFIELKKTLSCQRCPESHWACLDFHHRDPSTKTRMISRMVAAAMSVEKILAEIAKCDIICANCHRKLHAEERGQNGNG